ncbi:hypothetical protein [Dysgonomonas gadei]|uniref:Uncharacterized protein n=1 Tax=Dysgonomonas gadei ATCC BAA-286 TaxID=742766 RepID=F5ITP0_9BACT|nr:hypothetical protein [Dysgonomonas gadei]EGJ99424.1 hypothetical protein HMPREF9455_00457 [Dysgonomonas gadei ATCC BAA-286]
MKLRFEKLIAIMSLMVCLCATSHAQVTIGSGEEPDMNAILDLKETAGGSSTKGLLLPRVTLSLTTSFSPLSAHVAGMTVYNTATTGDVTPGYYINDGTRWVRSSGKNQFYMPSIILPTDPATLPNSNYTYSGSTFSVNLYNLYSEQYGLSSSTTSRKSSGAPALKIFNANQLDYYIIYFDNSVFSNVTISTTGVLTYQLASGYTISEKTFMNILFSEK